MKFVHPEFLWSLLALVIPVIIHLFNFRKYKTFYFSSLQFLKHVDQQTRSTQKIKHLLVLITRLLALVALIFAFAQPYLPVTSSAGRGGKPVLAIYLDNSFSMTARGTEGELLSEAREMARKLLNKTTVETRVLLTTNSMNGQEQRFITKIEALDRLDKIEPTALTRKLDDVINWQRNFIEKEDRENQKIGSVQYVIFSDFQKNTTAFDKIKSDQKAYYYPVKVTAQDAGNVYVDSVWFTSPFRKPGENNELNIRVVNENEANLTNVEIHCTIGSIKRDVFLDLPAGKSTTTIINYTENGKGFKKGTVSVDDKQLYWDDEYYFSYYTDDHTSVLIINGDDESPAISTVYGLEKHYQVKSVADKSFTRDDLNQADLIVLNGLNELPSGMAQMLQEFAQTGGTVALFPGTNIQLSDWNNLLGSLKMPLLGSTIQSGTKIDKLIDEDPFYYGIFEKKNQHLNLPAVSKIYRVTGNYTASAFELIRLQNRQPLFLRSAGELNVYLFVSSLSSSFGSFTSNALFPAIILRIGEMSQRKTPLALTIGKDAFYPMYKKQEDETPVHIQSKDIDYIPQLRTEGIISYLSLNGQEALENLKAGIYNLNGPELLGVLALNYDRTESKTACFNLSEVETALESKGIQKMKASEIQEGQSLTKLELDKPAEYWKILVVLALLFLLAEMALIKFWK